MVRVKITKDKAVLCRQKVFYRRLIPIAAWAGWGNVDVGNDQFRVPNFSFYGKFFQVGDHIATLLTMAVRRKLQIYR